MRQVAASRSYGLPSAAGGMLRPTNPASTMIVTMYGSDEELGGIEVRMSTQLARAAARSGSRAPSEPTREQERRPECAERRPTPEDQRRQRDEPRPIGHARLERAAELERQLGAGQPGEEPPRMTFR